MLKWPPSKQIPLVFVGGGSPFETSCTCTKALTAMLEKVHTNAHSLCNSMSPFVALMAPPPSHSEKSAKAQHQAKAVDQLLAEQSHLTWTGQDWLRPSVSMSAREANTTQSRTCVLHLAAMSCARSELSIQALLAALRRSREVGCRNPLLNESNLGCHRMAWDASIIGLGLKEEGPFSNTAWINTGLWVQNNQSHNSEMH